MLEDPVTIPCGHNYCLNCIKTYWDSKQPDQPYVCPQCRKIFVSRPDLLKNTTLLVVAEELKKVMAWDSPDNQEAVRRVCRTDQQLICGLHPATGHQGHNTVSAERQAKQKMLEARQRTIQEMIRQRKDDVTVLQQRAEVVTHAANKAVSDGQQILTEAIGFLEGQRGLVAMQVRWHQDAEEARISEAQERLEREIAELRSREAELEAILNTEDNNRFLLRAALLPPLRPASSRPQFNDHSPSGRFEEVTAALMQMSNKLQEEMTKIS